MVTPISFLTALVLASADITCAEITQQNIVQAAQPVPLVLRAQPVSLDNPDGRCVRNAISQIMVPAVIDILNKHLEKTGIMLDDAHWVAWCQNSIGTATRANLSTASLMRTALAVNNWTNPASIGTHVFNSVLEVSHYGLGATQYTLLARDIVDGVNQLTSVRMHYCQLPLDREHVKEFSAQDYVQSTLKENTCDYLMIDAGSSTTGAFDRHSCLGSTPLSTFNEKALPAKLTVTNEDGSTSVYEVVSFCNMERSGVITHRSSRWLNNC